MVTIPSPYRVLFILIVAIATTKILKDLKTFLSPYRVSFILTKEKIGGYYEKVIISVSLRSIIHSYLKNA